jgi:raffinose/stachyose/melibiose transport system permease protein
MKKLLPKTGKYAVLMVFTIFIIYPVYLILIDTFKSRGEIYRNVYGLPKQFDFANYIQAWTGGHLGVGYINSIIITVCSISLIVLLSSLAAFALSRRDFKLSKPIYFLFLAGMAIPFQTGIMSLYIQMNNMHLVNSRIGLMIIYTAFELPFAVFIMEGFFRTIPKEIEEASIVDGCSNYMLFSKIVIPLSPSVIATVIIFELVAIWNDMFFPLIFLSDSRLNTLPLRLLSFKGKYVTNYPVIFAGVIISIIPIVIIYISLQQRFIEGLTAGSIKG